MNISNGSILVLPSELSCKNNKFSSINILSYITFTLLFLFQRKINYPVTINETSQ